nr:MAG: hypothetical protein [Sesarmops intermedium nimavirus]
MNVNQFFGCVIIVTLIFVFTVIACVAINLSGALQNTLSASTAAAAAASGIGVGGLLNSALSSNYLAELEPPDKKKKKNASEEKDTKNKTNNRSKNEKGTKNTKNKTNRINNRKGGPKSRFRSSAKSFKKSRPVRGARNAFRKSRWRIKRTMTRVRSGGRSFLRGGLRMAARFNPFLLLL